MLSLNIFKQRKENADALADLAVQTLTQIRTLPGRQTGAVFDKFVGCPANRPAEGRAGNSARQFTFFA
jgi:hypothetical protein